MYLTLTFRSIKPLIEPDRMVIGEGNSENDDDGMSENNYFLGEFQENWNLVWLGSIKTNGTTFKKTWLNPKFGQGIFGDLAK